MNQDEGMVEEITGNISGAGQDSDLQIQRVYSVLRRIITKREQDSEKKKNLLPKTHLGETSGHCG